MELTGGRLSVRIRGTDSLLAGKEPLWVVDGLALQSGGVQLATLNPRDVESITVLKNPDQTAIYGSRGANGVILIKTKR
jgi:TonB-dependent SusC/RagA subfamily outer membrane receptor